MNRAAIVLTAALVFAGPVGFAQPSAAPTYLDKPLEVWIAALTDKDANTRRLAAQAMAALGPKAKDAVLELAKRLDDPDAWVRRTALEALAAIGPEAKDARPALHRFLKAERSGTEMLLASLALVTAGEPDPKPLVRRLLVLKQPKLAMSYLYSDGSARTYPVPLVPAVAALLKDDPEPAVRADAATALGYTASIKFGDLKLAQAVLKEQPALVAALADKDRSVRYAAAVALHTQDPKAMKPAIPVLIDLMSVQKANAGQVGNLLRGVADDAVPQLIRGLDQKDEAQRAPFTLALAAMGESAMPGLRGALTAESAAVRAGAARALECMSGVARPAVPDLLKALNDQESDVRLNAATAVIAVEPPSGKAAVPALIGLLSNDRVPTRLRSAAALAAIGPNAKSAVDALRKALADSDANVRREAAVALVAVDRSWAAPAIPVLVEALDATDAAARRQVAKAAGAAGAVAKLAVPRLRAALTDADLGLRVIAAESLVRIDRAEATVALPALSGLVADRQQYSTGFPLEALNALVRLGADAEPAIPKLLDVLKQKECWFRYAIAGAVIKMDSARADAMFAFLCELMRQPGTTDWYEAAGVLEEMGPDAKRAVPHLVSLLKHDDMHVRRSAVRVLGKIGSGAKAAVPDLLPLLKDKTRVVAMMAERALQQIDPDAAKANIKK